MNGHVHKIEKSVIIGALLTGWILLLAFAYSMFFPVKTIVIKNYSESAPVPVLTKVVLPGERLQYELDYCKYIDDRATVYRTLVDGQVITLQPTEGGLPEGCRKTIISTTIIPVTINPGEYYLDVYLDYQINFFRVERVHYRTEYFRVGQLPEADKEVEVIERDGQTIIVPVPTYTSTENDSGEEPAAPTIIIENRNETQRQEQRDEPEPRPDLEPEERSILDNVRDLLGV